MIIRFRSQPGKGLPKIELCPVRRRARSAGDRTGFRARPLVRILPRIKPAHQASWSGFIIPIVFERLVPTDVVYEEPEILG